MERVGGRKLRGANTAVTLCDLGMHMRQTCCLHRLHVIHYLAIAPGRLPEMMQKCNMGSAGCQFVWGAPQRIRAAIGARWGLLPARLIARMQR